MVTVEVVLTSPFPTQTRVSITNQLLSNLMGMIKFSSIQTLPSLVLISSSMAVPCRLWINTSSVTFSVSRKRVSSKHVNRYLYTRWLKRHGHESAFWVLLKLKFSILRRICTLKHPKIASVSGFHSEMKQLNKFNFEKILY